MAAPMRSTDFRSIVEPILNECFDGVYDQRADEWSTVSIYNSTGVQLFLSQVKGKSYIDIANLPQGQYIVKFSAPNGTMEKKLLKK